MSKREDENIRWNNRPGECKCAEGSNASETLQPSGRLFAMEDCGNKWVNKPRCPWINATWFVKAGSDSSVVTAKVGQQPLWGWCNKQETGQRQLRTYVGVLYLNFITWSMQIHAWNQTGLTVSFAASCDHGGPSNRPTWGSKQNQLLDGKKNAVPLPSELPCWDGTSEVTDLDRTT